MSNNSMFAALQALAAAASLRPTEVKQGKKGFKSGMTRHGAIHKLGSVFKARKVFSGTPAEYRRGHYGRLKIISSDGKVVKKVVPNYMKPHTEPRARNVQ